MKLLIAGSRGFLGSHLLNHFEAAGVEVLGSTRASVPGRLTLDLATSDRQSMTEILRRAAITHVVLCAAVTDVDACERDPEASRAVNVTGMCELLLAAKELGIFPIFFSTDYVFDGSRDHFAETDPCAPSTRYGRQKVELEAFMRTHFEDHLIFRTSKLMSMDLSPRSILADAAHRLRSGVPFLCPSDQWITPVYVEDVARAIETALERKLTGTFHLATRGLMTRYQLALRIAQALELDAKLIQPCKLSELKTLVPRACHNSLQARRFEQCADFRFREIDDGLDFLRSAN